MPLFTIKYLGWEQAQLTGAQKVPYTEWLDYPYVGPFTTFNEAKETAKSLEEGDRAYEYVRDEFGGFKRDRWGDRVSARTGDPQHKYVAFKLPDDADYMTREPARIEAGEYELLPEHMRCTNDYPHLFPRIIPATDNNPVQIGYFESTQDAMYDRLTKVKPTRFLSYYFGQEMVWDYMAELGLAKAGFNLAFVNTREDIRFVYEHGPESCMSSPASSYYGEAIHPVEAYASPDLELAILYRGDNWRDEGEDVIVARALCNKNTKEWVRIYGDTNRMEKSLEELGYSSNQWCLGGCRLLKIYGIRDGVERRNIIMAPYLDGGCTNIIMSNSAEYLTIKDEERYIQGNTSGYARI